MKTTSYLVSLIDINTKQKLLESELKNSTQSWVIYNLGYETEYDFEIILKYQNTTTLSCTQRLKTGSACSLFISFSSFVHLNSFFEIFKAQFLMKRKKLNLKQRPVLILYLFKLIMRYSQVRV